MRFFRCFKGHVGAGRKLPAQPGGPAQFYRSPWQQRQDFFITIVNHPHRPPV